MESRESSAHPTEWGPTTMTLSAQQGSNSDLGSTLEWFTRDPSEPTIDPPPKLPLGEQSIVCVLTRFRFRRPHHLIAAYRDYRRVASEARKRVPDLLRTTFLVSGPTSCLTLSIWRNENAIAEFGSVVPFHVEAANRVFQRVAVGRNGRREIWSTKWVLSTASNNLSWGDFDLRDVVAHSLMRANKP